IGRSTNELDLATVRVDRSRDLDQTAAAVEELLAPALARLPRAASTQERTELRRQENATVVRQLLLYAQAHPASVRLEETTYDFACECGASGLRSDSPAQRAAVPTFRGRRPLV